MPSPGQLHNAPRIGCAVEEYAAAHFPPQRDLHHSDPEAGNHQLCEVRLQEEYMPTAGEAHAGEDHGLLH